MSKFDWCLNHPEVEFYREDVGRGVWRCDVCGDEVDATVKVYVSVGSAQTYHHDRTCPARGVGQLQVLANGGTPAPIEVVPLSIAAWWGRRPCRMCSVDPAIDELFAV